jgi:hypothetical protein
MAAAGYASSDASDPDSTRDRGFEGIGEKVGIFPDFLSGSGGAKESIHSKLGLPR